MHEPTTHETDPRERSFIANNFGLAPPRDGDHGVLASAAASWNVATARAIAASSSRITRVEQARREFREAMARHISPDAARRFRAFSRHQRDHLRELLRSGESGQRGAAVRKAQAESLRLMSDAGVDRDKLRAFYGDYKQSLVKSLLPERQSSASLKAMPLHQAPQVVRDGVMSGGINLSTTTSDGLTIFTPPFDGWWWKGSWWHSGGEDAQIDIYPDPATGSIGHRSEWSNWDASDADAFTLDYDTSVSVWYKPPKSGVVDVWIWATCSNARYDIYVDDEWGWSDSDTYMQSYLTANVSPVIDDEDRTENWRSHISGSPDGGSYVDDPFPPGNVQTFHLTTSQAIAAGVWSMLRVGTYEHRFTFLNDVSTRQLMRNRWFVNAIFVRTM
jgi:hypothetical protein